MAAIDLHPVKCGDCLVQLVVGIDEVGMGWGYCPHCRYAKPLISIVAEGLRGEITPPDPNLN